LPRTPLGGAHSAEPDPLAGFEGVYFYGRRGGEKREQKNCGPKEGQGKEGR